MVIKLVSEKVGVRNQATLKPVLFPCQHSASPVKEKEVKISLRGMSLGYVTTSRQQSGTEKGDISVEEDFWGSFLFCL